LRAGSVTSPRVSPRFRLIIDITVLIRRRCTQPLRRGPRGSRIQSPHLSLRWAEAFTTRTRTRPRLRVVSADRRRYGFHRAILIKWRAKDMRLSFMPFGPVPFPGPGRNRRLRDCGRSRRGVRGTRERRIKGGVTRRSRGGRGPGCRGLWGRWSCRCF
jgi:hypothetical protein